jgi:diguanylate cyclase (GGDEF)-like protein/PAS domain S-box-containing protein
MEKSVRFMKIEKLPKGQAASMNLEQLLPRVMDLLLDGICVVDANGRFVFVNAACEKIFGYTREELTGRQIFDLVHPDDLERTQQSASSVMAGEELHHFENRYIRKNGQVVNIMWTARWDAEKGLRLGVARDVTALKRAERLQIGLYRISEAAHHSSNLPELYEQIHQIINEQIPARNFFVALYDQEQQRLSFPYFVDERISVPAPQSLHEDMPISRLIRERKPLLLKSWLHHIPTADAALGDAVGAPLITGDTVIGAIVTHSYSTDTQYSQEDLDLLQYVSTQVANAIQRKQYETNLIHMASHDPLTNLPNRTLFNEHFGIAIKLAHRHDTLLGLLYLDLDNFKDINDNYGHSIGDKVLCELSRRLQDSVRASDIVGRIGGDEFVLLLRELVNPNSLDAIIQKINRALSSPCIVQGHQFNLQASIGKAVYPNDGQTISDLFNHADGDMYQEKGGARIRRLDIG